MKLLVTFCFLFAAALVGTASAAKVPDVNKMFKDKTPDKKLADKPDSLNMFRGNPQHTGCFSESTVINTPEVKWKFKTNGMIFSSPIISEKTIFFGSSDSCLYAVDENNGTMKWKYKTDGAVNSTPAVYGKIVLFGSMDGNFYALDAADGTLKWKFTTQGESYFTKSNYCGIRGAPVKDPFDFILSSPVIYNNIVFFGSGDGNIYALDVTSGKKLWSYKTGDVVHSSPAVYKGKVYVGSWDSFLYCIDAASGKLVWKLGTGRDINIWVMVGIQSSPAISNGTVYFGCRDGNLYAVNADSGKIKWKYDTSGSWVLASPSVNNNMIYFSTSDSKKFIAADISGKGKYEIRLNGYVFSSPALCSGNVYIGCYNGTLYSINADKGTVNWIFCTEANKNDPCDVLTEKGKARFPLDYTSADALWTSVQKLYTAGTILSSPVISNGVLYFGSTDGNLYALVEASAK